MKNKELIYDLAFGESDFPKLIGLSQGNLKQIYPEVYLQNTTRERRKRLLGKNSTRTKLRYVFNESAYVSAIKRNVFAVEESYYRSSFYRRLRDGFRAFARRLFFSNRALQSDIDLVLGSDFFEPSWYAENYQLQGSDATLARHYILHGFAQLLDPAPTFSTKAYLQHNPDVLFAPINPLVHYLRYGKSENRSIASSTIK